MVHGGACAGARAKPSEVDLQRGASRQSILSEEVTRGVRKTLTSRADRPSIRWAQRKRPRTTNSGNGPHLGEGGRGYEKGFRGLPESAGREGTVNPLYETGQSSVYGA